MWQLRSADAPLKCVLALSQHGEPFSLSTVLTGPKVVAFAALSARRLRWKHAASPSISLWTKDVPESRKVTFTLRNLLKCGDPF